MFRTAARSLARQPSFTLTAAGTLAVGIAAATTLFATVNTVLLRPLPYARPGDLYSVRTYFSHGRFTMGMVANEELAAVDALRDVVAGTAYANRVDGAIDTDAQPQQVVIYGVSPHFFDLFGVPVATGRPVGPSDDARGAPAVAVLSQAIWHSAFGARPDVVGRVITLAEHPVRVVGIARAGFDLPAGTDVWTNLDDSLWIGHPYEGWVRARPGTSLPLLVSRMNRTFVALAKKYPDLESNRRYAVTPLLDATVGSLGPILVILFGATVLLLLLAAVNVTNLMLARTTSRASEVAIRAALGATRPRIFAQLVTESLLIAVVGAAVGATLAWWAVHLLVRYGAAQLPRLGSLSMDSGVVVFVAVVAGVTGLLVGVVPGFRMADTDLAAVMNETGRGVRGSRRTRRLLEGFVIAEMAVSVAIVAGAGRLVRSYQHLESVDPGFNPHNLLAIEVTLPPPDSQFQQRRNAWWDETEVALRTAGAIDVAATSSLPLGPHEWDAAYMLDLVAHPGLPPERQPTARERRVTPDFFRDMGISLLEGRLITRDDGMNTEPVAVVNEAFARQNLGGASPIGEQIKGFHGHLENGKFVGDLIRVVGVVRDVKYAALSGRVEPIFYVPFAQFPPIRASIVVATRDGAPERHVAQFESAIRRVEPRLAIGAIPYPAIVALSLDRQRLGMWLMLGFAATALVLAAVGVFGVITYVVSQRIGELAVRQALGATPKQTVVSMMRDGTAVAAAGVGIGVAVAWGTGRLAADYIFDVSASDPVVLGLSAALVAILGILATFVPVRRAASIELVRALRFGP